MLNTSVVAHFKHEGATEDAGDGSTSRRQGSVSMRGLVINAATVDGRDCWTPYLEDNVVSLRARGDGACSIHGLLGKPDGMEVLTHPNPRGWIQNMVSRAGSIAELATLCSTAGQEQVCTNVIESIGNELLLPWLRGDDSQDPSVLRNVCSDHSQSSFKKFYR